MDKIKKAKVLYIYGAGKACEWLLGYLKKSDITPKAIVVSSKKGNPTKKESIDVIELNDVKEKDDDCLWLSAVKGGFNQVKINLDNHGYTHIIDATML